MPRISGGQAVVQTLVREGVEVVFGLPGVQMYGIVAALRDEPSIKFLVTRHEQATTFMADGYARASGKPGVALVVPGPGIYNAASGMATAFSRSSPVCMIAGQIPRAIIGKNTGGLHEINDQMDAIKPVVKWQKRVLHPGEISAALSEAFHQMKSGRPRPVEFELPPEAMVEVDDIDLAEPKPVQRVLPPAARIEEAAKAIAASKNPVIYAGGGVARADAEAELVVFAEQANIPVITSASGKGTIPDSHPLALGASLGPTGAVREIMQRADVVIAVGTRFSLRNPAGGEARVVHIDADPSVIGQIHKNTLGLNGDAKVTLQALSGALKRLNSHRESPAKMVKAARRRTEESTDERTEPQDSLLRALRQAIPREAVTIWGMTQLGYYARPFWPAYFPKTYIDSGYSGNLGYSFPTALGAKVARPDVPVVCVAGDGGFMYNSQELSTAVKYGINLVTVVFNDGRFGNVARDMDEDFGGDYETRFVNPDFVKLAEAYGAVGLRTDKPLDVADRVEEAIRMNRPVLIDVPVERMPRPNLMSARAPWTKPQTGLIQ